MKGFIVVVVLLTVGLFGVVIYENAQEQKKWKAFSAEHHCQVTGRVESSTSTGLVNGKLAVVTTPARITYTCDGGYTETRDAW